MQQQPAPGTHQLLFRGDALTFTLTLPQAAAGTAFLRTNLDHAALQRDDIIAWTERNQPERGLGWHDLPMEKIDERVFQVTVALLEVGHFEAKCLFFPEGQSDPAWPEGPNTGINVEPGEYLCANSIYCAFVRQFNGHRAMPRTSRTDHFLAGIPRLDERGYTVIPPSGTFRNLVKELDFIIHQLNCRIIHLLPINPTPTVYARMGRFGSPYAALDFTAVDPALAEFDRKATPLDQFRELTDAIHLRNAKLFLDLAINHTGWAAKLHETHPEWFVRDKDGSFHSPGAWGVTWGDLTELDHSRRDLWTYLADVFLTWCERGVDGFRCDAGYMIPVPAWQYIVACVRKEYPDTIFLLEGLGGDLAVTEKLLDVANLNWAYSELFQNLTRDQITAYLPYAEKVSDGKGIMVHYAETHDNERLAAKSPVYAKLRTTLCAMASRNGAFGFTSGVEWFATEKIDVHEANALNWGAAENQVAHLARLNRILISHPAFYDRTKLRVVATKGTDPKYDADTLGMVRTDRDDDHPLFILANLNWRELNRVFWTPAELPFPAATPWFDLLTGSTVEPEVEDGQVSLLMAPGEVRCLTTDSADLDRLRECEDRRVIRPDRIDRQRARAVALELICRRRRQMVMPEVDADRLAEALLTDPEDFCQRFCQEDGELSVVVWHSPADLRRRVMVPPGHSLLLLAPSRFRARILADGKVIVQRDSLKTTDGRHFMLFAMPPTPKIQTRYQLRMDLFGENNLRQENAELLLLSRGDDPVPMTLDNDGVRAPRTVFLAGNGRGAMCHIPLPWGEVASKYDALLAANLHPEHPEDRHVMWTRCRAWLRRQAHSQPCWIHAITNFRLEHDGAGRWDFHLPAGSGRYVDLTFRLAMVHGRNAVTLDVARQKRDDEDLFLPDNDPVQVILRPDLEDRNFHQLTKAAAGPEKNWPGALTVKPDGVTFAPAAERKLRLAVSSGTFRHAPEWQRGVHHPLEAERGLESVGDLFSPGYFDVTLRGGESARLVGQVMTPDDSREIIPTAALPMSRPAPDFAGVMQRAMDIFVVRRDQLKTVIAGYPWFLDWGRDTLICARGLIAAGRTGEVADILLAFAKFAEKGTLPNNLSGAAAVNRDTSDAPLWLILACRDFHQAHPEAGLLDQTVPGRKIILREILKEIVEGYLAGTPNGIRVDPESGLVFSPAHFTWMDTNFPAGTPRQGYPIEIQALWFAALRFLAEIGAGNDWVELADTVRHSVENLFVLDEHDGLSDCLHAASPAVGAAAAVPDDHLRPNQLLAITLGLVEDRALRERILTATAELLVPGAICSLADRTVRHPLPIRSADGRALNDPLRPYWGRYEGDEDTRRKPAYHNGTAWTWIFPSYPEAYLATFGEPGRCTAKAILASAKLLLSGGCFGQLPEILDGDLPHAPRGCDAQAWAITELYRVWKMVARK